MSLSDLVSLPCATVHNAAKTIASSVTRGNGTTSILCHSNPLVMIPTANAWAC